MAIPCLARIACTRFLTAERIRVSVARWRSSSRRSRRSRGAMYASGEKPRAQQVRERLGVDRVGLHACRGNRAGAEAVEPGAGQSGLLEQFSEPLPAVGRPQRDVRVAVLGSPSSSNNVSRSLTIRRESSQLALLVDHGDVRRLRCRSMPTQRVALVTVGPPLRVVAGRAAQIRAVSTSAVRDRGPTTCRAGQRRPDRGSPPDPS